MSRSSITTALGRYRQDVDAALADMGPARLVARLWERDHRLWKPDPTEIDNRLGWLTVAEEMQAHVPALSEFAESVRRAGFRDVVLLGMGGSSLGPEVLRQTFGSARGCPRLTVLDSTVPGTVRAVTESIQPAKTLFIVASKSGGTIEVMSLFAYFWDLVSRAKGNTGGKQFIAITDPGTSLVTFAEKHGFRRTFTNPADIGGRYSVLSYFGLVPAALIGMDLDRLLDRAVAVAEHCRPQAPASENPGAALGAVMGRLNHLGRDKITLLASPQIASFGLWAEQLLAESTGKEGKGLIPVAQEPLVPIQAYGDDRLFVYLRLDRDKNERLDRHVSALTHGGHPVVQLRLRDRYDLGAEFFRWEFATAVAGHYLGIHPFDQPNVQESKDNTKRLLAQFERDGRLPDFPHETAVTDLLATMKPGSYVAILAYLPPSRTVDTALTALRKNIATTYRVATTAGYGPRYLHSTGQLHKGGPDEGVFLELIDRMRPDVKIPGASYTFGTLAAAQAVGDVESLRAHGRPVVAIELDRSPADRIVSLLRTRTARTRRPSATSKPRRHRARP